MPRHLKDVRRQQRVRRRLRGPAAAGLVLYPLFLGAVAFWPSPVDGPARNFLQTTPLPGLPSWVDYAVVEWCANVALFIPLGLLIALLLPRRHMWLACICGAVTSMGIEAAQSLFLPLRYATVNDVAANSIGTVLGVLTAFFLSRPVKASRRDAR